CVRFRLRAASLGRLSADRVPGAARRIENDLPADGGIHVGLSAVSSSAVVRAVIPAALVGLAFAALYVARDALLVTYISVLLAIGLGPLVHRIEQAVPAGARALPRWS